GPATRAAGPASSSFLSEEEVVVRDQVGVANAGQTDGLTEIMVDGDQCVRADVLDRDVLIEVGFVDSKADGLDKIVTAGRIRVEAHDAIVAETSRERERVAAKAAVEGVVACAAAKRVVTGAA